MHTRLFGVSRFFWRLKSRKSLLPHLGTRLELFEAIITEQSYLLGFQEPAMTPRYMNDLWFKFKLRLKTNPTRLASLFASRNNRNRDTYVDLLLSLFPTLLHNLFRYAGRILGHSANVMKIVDIMKARAKSLFPNCPIRSNLAISKRQFWNFFKKFQGKLVRPTSKPRLTDDHKRNRVLWAKKWKKRIDEWRDDLHYCFLDEKWFYTTSRRKKFKILPKADFETEEETHVSMPRLRSRRHATKVMFQAIVARPHPLHKFDGKVYNKRVSKEVIATKNSYNLNISNECEINHELKRGDWKNALFYPFDIYSDIKVHEAFECVFDHYDISEDKFLAFSYKTFRNKDSYKWVSWVCINPMNISSKTEPSPLHLEPTVHCALMTLFYTKIQFLGQEL